MCLYLQKHKHTYTHTIVTGMTNMGWLLFDVTKKLILLCAKLPSRLYNWLLELGKHLCSYLLYFLDFYNLTEAVWCGFEELQCDEVQLYKSTDKRFSCHIEIIRMCCCTLSSLNLRFCGGASAGFFSKAHLCLY